VNVVFESGLAVESSVASDESASPRTGLRLLAETRQMAEIKKKLAQIG
jgi:hypothetical protein